MKRGFIILFLLIFIPVSYAGSENYTTYTEMTLLHSASSEAIIEKTGNNPRVLGFDVKLNLIPRGDERQVLLNQEVITKPEAKIDYNPEFENIMEIKWSGDIDRDTLSYEVDTRLLVKRVIHQIGTVKFPIQNIEENYKKYTRGTKYIDLDDDIMKKANEIATGESNLYSVTYTLAEWIRANIRYSMNTMTEEAVQKSSWVLVNRQGVCDEITNLFISFCRALGIPARFITGVAYSNMINGFGNHGWAEVYFPEYGWVPFDITYGEYGWLDATHIELNENEDSDVFSVDYTWKSSDVDIKTRDLNIKTLLVNEGKKANPVTKLEVNLLKDNVGFGSYVPIQIILENMENYYVADKVYLTKAPEVSDENVKVILLKPKEIKEEYWLVHIPSTMESGYKYSTVIGVNSAFGASSQELLNFNSKGDAISEEEAEAKIEELRKREEKKYFSGLNLGCDTLKEMYYPGEEMKISCSLKNTGNVLLDDMQICLREDCRGIEIGISEEKQIEFETFASNKIPVAAENEEMIKQIYLEPKIIEIPKLEIFELTPDEINYREKKQFSFVLSVENEAYDIIVKAENQEIHFDKLNGKKTISAELKGSKLVNGLDIKISYKDEAGKEYTKEKNIVIKVNNIPWYARIFGFLF